MHDEFSCSIIHSRWIFTRKRTFLFDNWIISKEFPGHILRIGRELATKRSNVCISNGPSISLHLALIESIRQWKPSTSIEALWVKRRQRSIGVENHRLILTPVWWIHSLKIYNGREDSILPKECQMYFRLDSTGEVMVKRENDPWIVAKRSDMQELIITVNQKNANLKEVRGRRSLIGYQSW